MRLSSVCLSIASAAVLSGCALSGVIFTSPQVLFLEKADQDRYLVKEVSAEIEGTVESIKSVWRCTHGVTIPAGGFTWSRDWKAESYPGLELKALPSGNYLVMSASASRGCEPSNSLPALMILDPNTSQLKLLKYKGTASARAASKEEWLAHSRSRSPLAASYGKHLSKYATIRVSIWEHDEWAQKPDLKQKLEPLTKLTFADEIAGPNAQSATPRDFQLGPKMPQGSVPSSKNLSLDALFKSGDSVGVYGLNESDSLRLCIEGRCRQLPGRYTALEFYEPSTKRIVRLSAPNYWQE